MSSIPFVLPCHPPLSCPLFLSYLPSALSLFFSFLTHGERGEGRHWVRKPVIIEAIFRRYRQIRLISHSMIYRKMIIGAFYDQVRIIILMFSPYLSLSRSFFLCRQFSVQFVLIVTIPRPIDRFYIPL